MRRYVAPVAAMASSSRARSALLRPSIDEPSQNPPTTARAAGGLLDGGGPGGPLPTTGSLGAGPPPLGGPKQPASNSATAVTMPIHENLRAPTRSPSRE